MIVTKYDEVSKHPALYVEAEKVTNSRKGTALPPALLADLKALRESSRITQEVAAHNFGTTKSNISAFENGRNNSLKLIFLYVTFFGTAYEAICFTNNFTDWVRLNNNDDFNGLNSGELSSLMTRRIALKYR